MNAAPIVLTAASSSTAHAPCPLNHGLAVLDQLLAAITFEGDAALLDLVLDFRLVLRQSGDADTILSEYFRVRDAAEERHYLACFRLRRWLESEFVAEVKLDRTQSPRLVPVRLDVGSYRQLCAHCAFAAIQDGLLTAWVRVQFSRAASSPAPLT
jgi:hypothetical protein